MAYINVAEWSSDLVCCWLKGLDDSMKKYISFFANNGVGGQQLLNIRPYELEQLGMYSIGDQEIVLEAVENLRNFHYNLDRENLQFLALQVASASRNLYRQLSLHCDNSKLETQILSDIARTISTIKPVISWLDRTPFYGQLQFNEIRKNMSRLGLEMATIAQRDRFVENPVEQIRMTADKLTKLADYIIQDITDPMLLQPASLNLVTLKKRENDVGFSIEPSFHGIHRITEIKYNSPAHTSGKIEDGDEIVQINYQTVVGWQYKTVILQLRESSPDVLLTLKKRPKHTKIYGQIYMQPYRLPSKKRTVTTRWSDNLPSPRTDFLTVPDFNLPLKIVDEKISNQNNSSDTDSSCSDILTPTDSKSVDKEIRLYYPKPRAVLQRRNTICGDELSSLKNVGSVPLWHERQKSRQNGDPSSPSLRDKSISFGYGLECAASRPTTCLGISTVNSCRKFNDLIGSLPEINKENSKIINGRESESNDSKMELKIKEEKSKPGVCKVVRFDANMKYDYPVDNKYTCNVENTILETFEPIPYVDDDDEEDEEINNNSDEKSVITLNDGVDLHRKQSSKIFTFENNQTDEELCQAVNTIALNRRGRLDKSHSTPAYDNSGEESDTPPAIEPRKEFLITPPPPPPRPKKSTEPQTVPVPPPKPQFLAQKQANSNLLGSSPAQVNGENTSMKNLNDHEQLELMTQQKSKMLTVKKKNSLMAKRRKVTLKVLGTGDIQGHLYRRTKDKRGVTFWDKLYFVLIETILYGFRTKEAPKANCMVVLPGFTVGLAKEVHSKPFAFKVYHSSKTFYFAAESSEALNQWMDFIHQATMKNNNSNLLSEIKTKTFLDKDLFSEADSSDNESIDTTPKQLCTPSPVHMPFVMKDSRTQLLDTSPSTANVKTDNKYLGSLKKLTKLKSSNTSNTNTNNQTSNSNIQVPTNNDKKLSSDIPVPTAQFRCYRKVPGGSFGLQIGTQISPYHDNNYSVHLSNQSNQKLPLHDDVSKTRKLSTASNQSHVESIINQENEYENRNELSTMNLHDTNKLKLRKTSPYNFIHASNPNLVEFDFQTSKTFDHAMPKLNLTNSSWDAPNNSLQGFVTLKDLMLQKQEEDAQEMYNHRVFLGVEKKEKSSKHRTTTINKNEMNESTNGGNTKSKIQMRRLPKTPDYEMSFKPDDEDIKRTRTKEGLKLRDFGYESISGDDTSTTIGGEEGTKKTNSNTLQSNKKKMVDIQEKINNRGGSFKKTKGKFEAFKTSSERIFQFKYHSKDNNDDSKSLKSTSSASYSPMTLPLNKKSQSQFYNVQQIIDQQNGGSPQHINIKKSQTYNNEFKDNKIKTDEKTHHRKNSAPMPILSKFSFSGSSSSSGNAKTIKEKKLLGSPSLHRAIFGRSSTNRIDQYYDHEIFCPITYTKNTQNQSSDTASKSYDTQSLISNNSIMDKSTTSSSQSTSTTISQSPEYPNIECPPVFKAETYSLSDPNASLTLLRRRNNLEDCGDEHQDDIDDITKRKAL